MVKLDINTKKVNETLAGLEWGLSRDISCQSVIGRFLSIADILTIILKMNIDLKPTMPNRDRFVSVLPCGASAVPCGPQDSFR